MEKDEPVPSPWADMAWTREKRLNDSRMKWVVT